MIGVDHERHAGVAIVSGNAHHIKKTLLDYCLSHFDEEHIWLADSLQIFDPYYLSSVNVSRTRSMLHSIRVSRPFTLYQLHDKIYSLTRVPLDMRSTIIISGMDCFLDDARTEEERTVMIKRMIGVLKRLRQEKGAALIIGCRTTVMRQHLCTLFNSAQNWEESVSKDQSEMVHLPDHCRVLPMA